MTHGFFKGLLFLGSGSVIHAVHEEQDMRRMGGLREEDPAHLPDDADRLDRDRRHPAAGRLLQQGRDPRRGVQERLPVGLGDRDRRRDDDRVLHVPADRADVLGREPGRPGGRAAHPRVAVGDDDAALAAGDPVGLPRPRPVAGRGRRSGRCSGSTDQGLLAGWLEPVFEQGNGAPRPRRGGVPDLRHRRRAARRRASRSR